MPRRLFPLQEDWGGMQSYKQLFTMEKSQVHHRDKNNLNLHSFAIGKKWCKGTFEWYFAAQICSLINAWLRYGRLSMLPAGWPWERSLFVAQSELGITDSRLCLRPKEASILTQTGHLHIMCWLTQVYAQISFASCPSFQRLETAELDKIPDSF